MYYTHNTKNQNDSKYQRFSTTKLKSEEITIEQYREFEAINKQILGLTKKIKDWLTNNQSAIKYSIFNLPKMTGGFRTIKAPEEKLKSFMREIKFDLESIGIVPHDSAYAYIPNRDCLKAIQCHQRNKSNWFLKMDLEKFFNNCSEQVIAIQLKKLYPFSLMTETDYTSFISSLCGLACHENELPQGTPLSPILTNWLMISIDTQINNALAERSEESFIYTRYADDLLVSSKQPFRHEEIVELVKGVLEQEGTPFTIKDTKTRYGSRSGKNWNLGIMYNKDHNLTVGHKRKRRIKTMLFQFYRGQRDRGYALELNGELAYLKNIEPDYHDYLIGFMNSKYRFNFKKAINIAIKQN
ncbi:reverse transcriptase domain-containing protein [Bacillus cereus group sp. N6]|uniref:reverse transcriptase domain-containing protein n=1 Tax=Bacillus cereus group sp. N6 TaxID=2794583 RepID=UPI001F5B882A|nr:reverse transcriptase domain-containing protein [Bacillus cereus group sp. N6]